MKTNSSQQVSEIVDGSDFEESVDLQKGGIEANIFS